MTRITPATAVLLLCVLLSIAVILGSCHSGSHRPDVSTAATVLRGDLDGDGLPSVGDAIGILRIVVGLDAQNPIADADGDGNVGVADAIAVLRCVVGLDEWPLGEMEGPPTRTIGPGTVNEGDFVVGAGERVECAGDTIIECTTATIAGELFSPSPTNAGESAGSITIQAQGDVLLTGAMRAGNGSDGDLSTSSGQGGNGGSVTISSANGDITIGVEVQSSADVPEPYLGAGDAGMGADDLLTAGPGAGGQGGSVTLSCPNGLLTLHPRSGLIHLGNGGDGGTGHLPADSEAELGEPADHNPDGGNSGTLAMESQDFAGLEEQDGALVVEPADMLTGGNGGDGGGLWIGVEVGADPSDSVQRVQAAANLPQSDAGRHAQDTAQTTQTSDEIRYFHGGGGGDAVCPGTAGNGGDASASYTRQGVSNSSGVGMRGDDGGNLGFSFRQTPSGDWLPVLVPRDAYRGGNGGSAYMQGYGDWSPRTRDCQDGKNGGPAHALGGNGGRVFEDGLPPLWLANMTILGGKGGNAKAVAGYGAEGGKCCEPPVGPGGKGGDAGPLASATGGDGGDQVAGKGGDAGSAKAEGANGGKGGDGTPPGTGGSPTQTLVATAGQPGDGSPRGAEASAETSNGNAGGDGAWCPGTEPALTVTTTTSAGYGVQFYSDAVSAAQVQPSFTLGGVMNRISPPIGHSMIFSADRSRLWLANELFGRIALYRSPATGGDRPADVALRVQGTQWRAIWYEEGRDIVYATGRLSPTIYAWDGASSMASDTAPTRTFAVPGALGGAHLTGAPNSDYLFAAVPIGGVPKVFVYPQAHTANGETVPARVIEPQGFGTHALAWDPESDLLFLGESDGNDVFVYTDASSAEGGVTPARTITVNFTGMAGDDAISGLASIPEHNLLIVSMFSGQILAYRNASAANGTPAPDVQLLTDGGVSLGVMR